MKRLKQVLAIALLIFGCKSADAQIYGQPYIIPAGFEAYQAGTMIMYGGYQYVIMPDRTMLLHPPICHDHVSNPDCQCTYACPCPHRHHVSVVYIADACAPVTYAPVIYYSYYVRRRGCH